MYMKWKFHRLLAADRRDLICMEALLWNTGQSEMYWEDEGGAGGRKGEREKERKREREKTLTSLLVEPQGLIKESNISRSVAESKLESCRATEATGYITQQP